MPRPFRASRADIEETVDHRQAVALLIAQASSDELPGPTIYGRFAIFDDIGPDRRLLDHVREVALVHFRHATAGVTCREIAAEQLVLLLGRPRLAGADFQVRVTAEQLALSCGSLELRGEHANGNAGRAIDAARAISDGLAAPEADAAQSFVEFAGVTAVEFGEDFPLHLAREVRAWTRVRYEEFWEAKRCAHPRPHLESYERLYAAGKRR